MARLALAVVLTAAAGITAVVTHHPRRPAPAASEQLVPAYPDRASRSQPRRPLPGAGKPRRRLLVRHLGPRPTPGSRVISGVLSDVTEYCATGNRNAAGRWPQLGDVAVADRSIRFGTRVRIAGNLYTVEDWIGWGSQFDIYGGNDAGCEQRALTFGRKRERVVVER